MARLAGRLNSIIGKTADAELIAYTLTHLGKSVSLKSSYWGYIQKLRHGFMKALIHRMWIDPKSRLHLARFKLKEQLKLKKLMLASLREPAYSHEPSFKQHLLLDTVIHDFASESPKLIAERISDKNELVRILAIKTAAKKWLPVERELIKALADPSADVRKAAHEGLVRLSRGNDFGPSYTTTSKSDIRSAQKRWSTWLELQRSDSDIIEVKR